MTLTSILTFILASLIFSIPFACAIRAERRRIARWELEQRETEWLIR